MGSSRSDTPSIDVAVNVLSFAEKTTKHQYSLSIANGQRPSSTAGDVGDIWFACETGHFLDAYSEMKRAKRCAQMSGFPGTLWFRSLNQWVEVDRKVIGVTSHRHPSTNSLFLDSDHMSWRAAGSVSTSKKRKIERKTGAQKERPAKSSSPGPEALFKVPNPSSLVPVRYLPIPSSHPLFTENLVFAMPEQLLGSLANPNNSWMVPLCLEWQAAAFFNNENQTPGEEIWSALLGYRDRLSSDPEDTKRKLVTNLSSTPWKEAPPLSDILQEYHSREDLATISTCGIGQVNVVLSPWRVLSTFMEGATSHTALCSISSAPASERIIQQCCPTLPTEAQPAPGECSLWKNPRTDSVWEFAAIPAAGIILPHVDTWVTHAHINHLGGKKLWMMWPGTTENYQRLYAAAFNGHNQRMSVARAVQVLDGLELLLAVGNSGPSWTLPPGTIHAVLTLSRVATHAGFYYLSYSGWKECRDVLNNLMETIGEVGFNGDTTTGNYLLETLQVLPGWVKLALERRKRGIPDEELEEWITDIVPSIEAKLRRLCDVGFDFRHLSSSGILASNNPSHFTGTCYTGMLYWLLFIRITPLLLLLLFMPSKWPCVFHPNEKFKGPLEFANHKRFCEGWISKALKVYKPPEVASLIVEKAIKRRKLEHSANAKASHREKNANNTTVPSAGDFNVLLCPENQALDFSPPETIQPPPATSRSGRQRQLPKRFVDMIPSQPMPFPHIPQPSRSPSPELSVPSGAHTEVQPRPPIISRTAPNVFGLYREYARFPQNDPEDAHTLDDYCSSPNIATNAGTKPRRWWVGLGGALEKAKEFYAPFMNATTYRLMKWFYSSTTKSLSDLDSLVKDVLLAPDFDSKDLKGFSAEREGKRVDKETGMAGTNNEIFMEKNGWKVSSVELKVPFEGVTYPQGEDSAPTFPVHGIQHRSLTKVIETAFSDPAAASFHYTPHKLFWQKTPNGPSERLFSELYNSDAFLAEHAKLQQQKSSTGPNANLETAVAAIMLWSDATHLADFGSASLWPIYCYFGNQSKYERLKPSNFAAHHIAYIPPLPRAFQDWYRNHPDNNKKPSGSSEHVDNAEKFSASRELMTHLKRELMHAIWTLLLDPEFRHAYEHGIPVDCADGVRRLLFPRFFTYSADYPEKALLATIRFLGGCPCPRCKIKKDQIRDLGTDSDNAIREDVRCDNKERRSLVEKARILIFKKAKGVASACVEKLLKPLSMVPTCNAFSADFLVKDGFDYHRMFVPDLLHEFELGTWKAAFTHLMRSTIRRFSEDASAMKKLAGRDFEDLLQCSIPVFDQLLPEPHNSMVLDLLFTLGTWHALAKLRLHSETTLRLLQDTTAQLGDSLRKFQDTTCAYFYTEELPDMETARGHQKAKTTESVKGKGKAAPGRLFRSFNLLTYKLHALGDYVKSIIAFGTSDGYSTQTGELEHRRVKNFYVRTNKRSTFAWQIAKHERRERLLHQIGQAESESSQGNQLSGLHIPFEASEPLSSTSPIVHYHMSRSRSFPLNVTNWLYENSGDPALEDFLPKLKDHILNRLEGLAPDSRTYTDGERNKLTFTSNRIYRHKYCRINYTTYDMQRAQDSINPRTHADIMVLAGDPESETSEAASNRDDHPYLYARVLGIFHADVQWAKSPEDPPQLTTIDFLWVRWFIRNTGHPCHFRNRRLPLLEFADEGAFGFLDPDNVLRGCHLIPAYARGQISGLQKSICRHADDGNCEWQYHYVNIFVDRDMFMRYLGGGIGHGSLGIARDTHMNLPRPAERELQQTSIHRESQIVSIVDDLDDDLDDDHELVQPEKSYTADECLEYGYPNPDIEPALVDANLEDEEASDEEGSDMDEDGEGCWDFDQPENDGYGAYN
ncbi:hypothetical protein NP233_g5674 [Leucocoprinus birnbaumii]|uniref:Uncharacterized protein n=1 Tax=Leucocoprinus birnbaumii TaxID=56174 RepID=A0AAD5VSF2_9AGAR|nr:hypothetical protein NP233_g5674 [Leucocoprinus birnbaumii]